MLMLNSVYCWFSELDLISKFDLWFFSAIAEVQLSGGSYRVPENSVAGTDLTTTQGLTILNTGASFASPKWAIVSPTGGHPFAMDNVDAAIGTLEVAAPAASIALLDYELQVGNHEEIWY